MKSSSSRLSATALIAMLAWLLLAGATTSKGPLKSPDKLVILSTSDVKGEIKPCG